MDIQAVAKEVMRNGPDRVIISPDGEATSPKRAREQYSAESDVVFIRNDGWTLGAPFRWEKVAERLWFDSWVGVMRRPSKVAVPYPSSTPGEKGGGDPRR